MDLFLEKMQKNSFWMDSVPLLFPAPPAPVMFGFSTKPSVVLTVPLTLLVLSVPTNVPQLRVPERGLSHKSLHMFHFLAKD